MFNSRTKRVHEAIIIHQNLHRTFAAQFSKIFFDRSLIQMCVCALNSRSPN